MVKIQAHPVSRYGLLSAVLRQRELGILLAAICIFAVFGILAGSNFVSIATWSGILNSASELGIIAVGVTMLMIAGEFDLSVGANYAFTAMIVAMLMTAGVNQLLAFLVGMALACTIGLANGLITVYLDIPSFITTLGTFLFWSGITLLVTGGMPVTDFKHSWLLTALAGVMAGRLRVESLWWLAMVIGFGLVLHRTPFGNWVFATGGRRAAARAVGVAVNRVRILCFVICGMLAGFAGIVSFAHLYSMSPSYGQDLELDAIAAAVVGGASLFGGQGTMFGAALGTIVLSMLSVGLVLSGASSLWYETFVGVIVVAAVAMHVRVNRWSQNLRRT